MMVGLKRISTVVGLLALTASVALGQGTVANPNQMTADSVAGALRASRNLSRSRIEIEAQNGLVILSGRLAHPALKAEALARAQRVPGVQGVIDRLQVPDRTVLPAQYQRQVAMGHLHGQSGAVASDASYGYGNNGGMTGAPPTATPANQRRVDLSTTAARFPKGRPRGPAAVPWHSRDIPTTLGLATLLTPISRRSAIRQSIPGKPGRTSGRSILIPKYLSTGALSLSVGMMASGGWTSRSTTPGPSSPRIRLASSPTDICRKGAGLLGLASGSQTSRPDHLRPARHASKYRTMARRRGQARRKRS